MTLAEWFAVLALLCALLVTVVLLSRIRSLPAEIGRKSVHVIMGLSCTCLPWIFDRPIPVWVLAALATVPILLLRLIPGLRSSLGKALHGIQRPSYGEILFAPAVATLFHMSCGEPILYLIPILILTLADATCAIAGTRWGKRHYACGDGIKSIEGSLSFILVSVACVFFPLICSGPTAFPQAILIALILSILAMMAEGFSDRGFDNLVIPLGCFFVLERIIDLEVPSLLGRLLVLLILLGLVISGSRWSSLSGAALLGGAMLGYGCAVLASWVFAYPLLGIFLCHLFTTRKRNLNGKLEHRLIVVHSHAIASLPWVLAFATKLLPFETALAGISFAMAAQLAQMDHSTRLHYEPAPNAVRSTVKGLVCAALPGLIWIAPFSSELLIPTLLCVAAIFLLLPLSTLMHRRFQSRSDTALWLTRGLLSFIVSLSALRMLQ